MASVGFVWEALAMGEWDLVKSLDLSSFDWRATHPDFGTACHAVLFGKIKKMARGADEESKAIGREWAWGHLFESDDETRGRCKENRLSLLRFVIDKGANPMAKADGTYAFLLNDMALSTDAENEETKVFDFSGKSPGECLLAVKRRGFKDRAGDFMKPDVTDAITKALQILCCPNTFEECFLVPAKLVETWEHLFKDSATHDVKFSALAASGSTVVEIGAHGSVLCDASPVLSAMLGTSGMKEGMSKTIAVKDVDSSIVRLFIALAYIGEHGLGDAETHTLASVLDLAHRWQALHIVKIVSSALQKQVDIKHFEVCLDTAVRLHLPDLRASCCAFAGQHVEAVRSLAAADRCKRSPVLQQELEKIVGQLGTKRRRTSSFD